MADHSDAHGMFTRLKARLNRVRVAVANIRDNPDMPRPWVRADASKVGREADVVLFQEINEHEDILDVRAGLGPFFRLVHTHLPIPIAFRWRKYKLVDKGWIKLHDGSAHVPNPSRFLSWVVLRRRFRPWSKPIVFMNTHWVNGAWTDKDKPHKDWRKEKWVIDWYATRAKVLEFYALGMTVVFGGDLNRLKVQKFHRDQEWAANVGILKLGYLQGSVALERKDVRAMKINSDHDAWLAALRMHEAVD